MGIYDEVVFDLDVHGFASVGSIFQTKSRGDTPRRVSLASI
jgi:hypothetical protein